MFLKTNPTPEVQLRLFCVLIGGGSNVLRSVTSREGPGQSLFLIKNSTHWV